MSHVYEQDREHECPVPLQRPVCEFDTGGMFFSPAGRWETITDRTPTEPYAARIVLHTDAAGSDMAWMFSRSTRLPYLPPWHSRPARVAVFDLAAGIDVEVTTADWYGHGHTITVARPVRYAGWEVCDQIGGATLVQITVPSKARARAEVNRRARAHAKRLRLPLAIPPHRLSPAQEERR